MATDVKKASSYLKGLAQTRARAAGDVLRLQALIEGLTEQLGKAQAELSACDLLIRKLDERLNPELIAPVRAAKTPYGALKRALVEYVRDAYPGEVSTVELCLAAEARLGLGFVTATERSFWMGNTMRRELNRLVKAGVLERIRDEGEAISAVARWRWRTDCGLSLDHWAALAPAPSEAAPPSGDGRE